MNREVKIWSNELDRLRRIEKYAADLAAIIGEFTDRNGLVQMSANADAVHNLNAALAT